jgi:lactoylglutathione lyase
MRFSYAIAYVQEVGRSVVFYERAFSLTRGLVDESGQYAEMETGETTLAFASNELGHSNLPSGLRENDPAEPPAGVEIAFVAEDVGAAFHSALEAGTTKAAEPKMKPWGQTVAYVRDPDGVLVETGARCSWLAVSVAVCLNTSLVLGLSMTLPMLATIIPPQLACWSNAEQRSWKSPERPRGVFLYQTWKNAGVAPEGATFAGLPRLGHVCKARYLDGCAEKG